MEMSLKKEARHERCLPILYVIARSPSGDEAIPWIAGFKGIASSLCLSKGYASTGRLLAMTAMRFSVSCVFVSCVLSLYLLKIILWLLSMQ
jgi:hypothetical protein